VGVGLVDIHVHFREPGQTHKGKPILRLAAAAAGGSPPSLHGPTPRRCRQKRPGGTIELINNAERKAAVHVYPRGLHHVGMKGQQSRRNGSSDGRRRGHHRRRLLLRESNSSCACRRIRKDGSTARDLTTVPGRVLTKAQYERGRSDAPRPSRAGRTPPRHHLARNSSFRIFRRPIPICSTSGGHVGRVMSRAQKDGINVTAEATRHHIA